MLAEGVGRRLENFFWRIWGNRRLLETLTGTLVAAIFSKISEGGYIRTTPTQSPRSSRSLGTFNKPQQPERGYAQPQPELPLSVPWTRETRHDDGVGDDDETETESSSSSRRKLPPRPPPILKKSRQASPPRKIQGQGSAVQPGSSLAGDPYMNTTSSHNAPTRKGEVQAKPSDRLSKTARFRTDALSSTIPSTLTIEEDGESGKPLDALSMGKQKASRRKTAVLASTGSSKRRPAMRQRSSQSSSSSASVTLPSRSETEPAGRDRTRAGSLAADIQTPEGFNESPVLAKRALGGEAEAVEKERTTEQTDFNHSPNRKTLADKGHPARSGTRTLPSNRSLSTILQKSTAAAATSASYQATGIMDAGQGSAGAESRSFDAEATGESNLRPLAGISRPVPGSSGNVQALPKTKSQLTLLLERNRRTGNDR